MRSRKEKVVRTVIQVVDEAGEVITSFDLIDGEAVGITREGYRVLINGTPLKKAQSQNLLI